MKNIKPVKDTTPPRFASINDYIKFLKGDTSAAIPPYIRENPNKIIPNPKYTEAPFELTVVFTPDVFSIEI